MIKILNKTTGGQCYWNGPNYYLYVKTTSLKLWLIKSDTVKLDLTTTPKRRSWAQDEPFLSVPIFYLGTQALINVSKKNTFIMWPQPYPIWTKIVQNVTKYDRVIFARLILPRRQTYFPATLEKLVVRPSLNVFKKTTCTRWPLYIGPQGSNIKQVWLHIKIIYHGISINLLVTPLSSAILEVIYF